MKMTNEMHIEFAAISENEAFARMATAAFLMYLDPGMMELEDIKTAVSEAVTNAIIHGYDMGKESSENEQIEKAGLVEMSCVRDGRKLVVSVVDHGVGIQDVEAAKQPFFTTKPEEERSGMGFSFMETFMDSLTVESEPGKGTKITMTKSLGADTSTCDE